MPATVILNPYSNRTRPPTPIQADGELIATEATEIVYEIVPGALQVFSPQA